MVWTVVQIDLHHRGEANELTCDGFLHGAKDEAEDLLILPPPPLRSSSHHRLLWLVSSQVSLLCHRGGHRVAVEADCAGGNDRGAGRGSGVDGSYRRHDCERGLVDPIDVEDKRSSGASEETMQRLDRSGDRSGWRRWWSDRLWYQIKFV
jgi:hypothetical protein